jgi:hypothetical protein
VAVADAGDSAPHAVVTRYFVEAALAHAACDTGDLLQVKAAAVARA